MTDGDGDGRERERGRERDGVGVADGVGVGLIEAIAESEILRRADPDDRDGDGIAGRPNRVRSALYVPPAESGAGADQLGRFGRKAQISNLLEQVTEAYHQDIGITSDLLPV